VITFTVKAENTLQSITWNRLLITAAASAIACGAKVLMPYHHFPIDGLYGSCLLINSKMDFLIRRLSLQIAPGVPVKSICQAIFA
jgi:hypothetical protein